MVALVRQPSVQVAVHQALPDMPAPPVTMPLSNTSSGSHGLPEDLCPILLPCVRVTVHQALPNMPAPPVTTPLTDTFSGSHGPL